MSNFRMKTRSLELKINDGLKRFNNKLEMHAGDLNEITHIHIY